jgi:hypothetical protein
MTLMTPCRKDTNGVIRALVELGVITPTGDMLSIRRAIGYFLENITRQTERQETIGVRIVWHVFNVMRWWRKKKVALHLWGGVQALECGTTEHGQAADVSLHAVQPAACVRNFAFYHLGVANIAA